MRQVISAGGIISKVINGNLFILLISTKDGRLSFPKGHLKDGEPTEAAAIREVKEEVGLKFVKIQRKLGVIVRKGTEPNGDICTKDIHVFTMKGAEYTYAHEENFVWIEFFRALNLMRHEEEKTFLKKHQRIIQECSSPYFEEVGKDKDINVLYDKFILINKQATDFPNIARPYVWHGNTVFEVGVSDGSDLYHFYQSKAIRAWGTSNSNNFLAKAKLKFQDSKTGKSQKLVCCLAENIIYQDLPDEIDIFYARFSLNLTKTKIFFLINNVLKKMKKGGYIMIEGVTKNNYFAKDGVGIANGLVKNNKGFLIRVWDEDFIKECFLKRLHLSLVELKTQSYMINGQPGGSLYFIAQKNTNYFY